MNTVPAEHSRRLAAPLSSAEAAHIDSDIDLAPLAPMPEPIAVPVSSVGATLPVYSPLSSSLHLSP